MDYGTLLQGFKKQHGLEWVVSFSGGYLDGDEQKVLDILAELFEELKEYASRIAIMTGGTKWNLSDAVASLAKKAGFCVIGVLPECGKKHQHPELDLAIVVPPQMGESRYGDETQVFVKASDAMVVIGGGPGAGVEVFTALKIASPAQRVSVVVIEGFGGIADMLVSSRIWLDKVHSVGRSGNAAGKKLIQLTQLQNPRTPITVPVAVQPMGDLGVGQRLDEIAACFPENSRQARELLEAHYDCASKMMRLTGEVYRDLKVFHNEHLAAFARRKKFGTPHSLKILEGSLQVAPGRHRVGISSERPDLDHIDRSGAFTKRFT